MRGRSLTVVATSALMVAVLAGCGPTPPQAPLPEAQRLNNSLSGISTACGLSYQSTGLDSRAGGHLGSIDASAAAQARKLASVYHRNPNWIYQGERVSFIVGQATEMLKECGLDGARRVLTRAVAAWR
jgi:hypothetical protein